jgi:hypothetical protein
LAEKGQVIATGNGQYHRYMTAYNDDTELLRLEVKRHLMTKLSELINKPVGAVVPIDITMRGEFLNGEDIIGYHYLHTTNPLAGDFKIKGTATIVKPCSIDFDNTYTWNDIIGPNKNYPTDVIKARIGRFTSLGHAKNYRLEINFAERSKYRHADVPMKRWSGWPWAK